MEKDGKFKLGKSTSYWQFYSANGKKTSEGHYENGKKQNWWLFYDDNEKINHKCQLSNNQKNGYCLMYKNEKLTSAVKYSKGERIKEWTDLNHSKKKTNYLI